MDKNQSNLQQAQSVTIKLNKEVIKHLQKYPWMSKDWRRAYGQRNQVEMSNRLLKDHRTENLGDPKARTGRGHAYNYLVAMLATVATNIRRIMVGITKLNIFDEDGKPVQRVRKRLDSNGYQLTRDTSPKAEHHEEQIAPPDPHRE